MKVIEFSTVSKTYDHKEPVLQNLDLQIHQGELITVLGASGSGKTTLLKMINGMIPLDTGEIRVQGKVLRDWDLVELRRQIGYVIQNIGLFPHMTIGDNIGYVLSLLKWDKMDIRKRCQELMSLLELPERFLDRYPRELSGGQKQRVGVARALAAKPGIVLMDEPFGAVDEPTRFQLQGELARIHHELDSTIVFVTHDIGEALRLGNRVILLHQGRIEQFGTPEELVYEPKSPFVKDFVGSRGLLSLLDREKLEALYHEILEGRLTLEEFYHQPQC